MGTGRFSVGSLRSVSDGGPSMNNIIVKRVDVRDQLILRMGKDKFVVDSL